MRVDIYGVFLLTGECEPVAARVRRSAAARVGRALCRKMASPARASVTLSDVLLCDGEIWTRCEIRACSERGARLVVVSIGPTLDGALEKSIWRLLGDATAEPISAVAHA